MRKTEFQEMLEALIEQRERELEHLKAALCSRGDEATDRTTVKLIEEREVELERMDIALKAYKKASRK